MTTTRATLLQIFAETAKNFTETKNTLASFEKTTTENITTLLQQSNNFPFAHSKPDEKHPMYTILSKTQEDLHKHIHKWKNEISTYEKNTHFRKRYGDSLLIYVYGQVKSGKSSIGNFIIYGQHNPSEDAVKNMTVTDVFMEAESGKINMSEEEFRKIKHFKIDYVEATSAIQGICIPGLTWVDSPGISSGTPENGELATSYLDSADLVLFVANGKSPRTRTGIEEIQRMYNKQKPFLFIIPRSDERKYDEDENGNVIASWQMKNDDDREISRNDCIDAIYDSCSEFLNTPSDKELLAENTMTCSCLFAEENPSPEGWKQSGMETLTTRIGEIAKNDSVRMKQLTPLRNLYNYNKDVLESLIPLKTNTNRLKQGIGDFQQSVDDALAHCKFDLEIGIKKIVTEAIQQHTHDSEAFTRALEKTLQPMLITVYKSMAERIHKAGKDLIEKLPIQTVSLKSMNFPSVEDIYQTTTYHSSGKKGFFGIVGGALGAIAGFAVAGPAGAALGATTGAAVGAGIGGRSRGEEDINTLVGDNRDEVANEVYYKLRDNFSKNLYDTAITFTKSYTKDVEVWLTTMDECIEQVQTTLEQQNTAVVQLTKGEKI